jgi:hypothetical protein
MENPETLADWAQDAERRRTKNKPTQKTR